MSRIPHRSTHIKKSISDALDETHIGGYGVGAYGSGVPGDSETGHDHIASGNATFKIKQGSAPIKAEVEIVSQHDASFDVPPLKDMLLNFGTALSFLEVGLKVRRDGWEFGEWLEIKQPDTHIMLNGDGVSVAWVVQQDDVLAKDWRIAP